MVRAQTRRFWQAFTPKLIIVWREGQLQAAWRADVLAGLTVAIVALPLAMALGIASGATPIRDVTAVIAGLLISLLGGSRVQIGGPTGRVRGDRRGSHRGARLCRGWCWRRCWQVHADRGRLYRLGKLIRFIPMPVITGFTAGIAVIIASSQVGDFFGSARGQSCRRPLSASG